MFIPTWLLRETRKFNKNIDILFSQKEVNHHEENWKALDCIVATVGRFARLVEEKCF